MKQTVHYISHTHYDAEVFLTRAETFEIGYSVALGALAAMREDPTFKFVLDQTCYIEPFLNAYPEERPFFEQMIREGRLEITCGMHAMPDVNLPSGESFIRQVLSGKGWCERELGLEIRCGWLLDTFGQHPQIPQLMVKCGFDRNLFQRLGTFDGPTEYWWRGLDGTKLFCHWMRDSYCILYPAPANLHEFRKFVQTRLKHLRAHAATPHLLAVSGADLTHCQPHVSRIFAEYNRAYDDLEFVIATPSEYFRRIEGLAEFPVLEGDLNPVFQGTYSARIAVKQWNRRLEALLADAEWVDAWGMLLGRPSRRERLAEAWEGVLFNQFHDIICGSHVDKVYAAVIDRFQAAQALAEPCLRSGLDALTEAVDTQGEGVPIVVFNPLGWERTDVVECRVGFSAKDVFEVEVRASSGRRMHCDLLTAERYETGGLKRATLLFIARDVPALGYEVYHVRRELEPAPESPLRSNQPEIFMAEVHRDVIENDAFRIEIDAWNGAVRSLVDKATGWEVIDPARPIGNGIVRELDNGNFWEYNGHCKGDAFHPMNRPHPLPAEDSNRAAFSHHYGGDGRVRNGKARTEFNIHFAFDGGYFATRVRLYAGIDRIDIQTRLVNQTERVRYRMALPTTLRGGAITREIPFGAIEQPEGEFPAQNWIDYGDGRRGVAVLNRGLPGAAVHNGVLLLALLKCTSIAEGYGEVGGFKRSTKTSDGYELGVEHSFDYALYPHAGDWRSAQTYRRGLEFNRPLVAVKARSEPGALPARGSLCSVSAPSVVVSALKADDAGTGCLVLRLYEAEGRAVAGVRLSLSTPMAGAVETNLIEREGTEVALEDGGRGLTLDFGPFEIKTVCLRPGGAE
jgi:alpha-mannosidase